MTDRPSARNLGTLRIVLPAAIVLTLLVLWELAVRVTSTPEYLIPAPSRVLQVLWLRRDGLFLGFGVTLAEAALGFLLANAVAVVFVTAFYFSGTAERSVLPLLVGIKSVPIVALAPLLVLWFGYGLAGKVVMAGLVAFFPMVVGLHAGVRSVPRDASDLMRSLAASRWETFILLCVPTAIPHLLAALKVSATLSVVGAIVAELMGARQGLGFTILMASYNVDTPLLFAAIVLSALAGGTLFLVALIIERYLWRFRLDKEDRQFPAEI